MTAEVITYRPRSAVRDVGKALGLSLDRVDALAKTMDHHPRRDEERLAGRLREGGPRSRQPARRGNWSGWSASCSAFRGICRSTSAAW